MRWVIVWAIAAALVAAGLIYTKAGPVTLLVCFFAWVGGVVSCLCMQMLGDRKLHGIARGD